MKAEDIIFKYVGLEGTLKSIGCYEDVIRAMNDYVKISKENTSILQIKAGDFVKEIGGDFIKVLKIEGRNIFLDYDDGLNCFDVDDIVEWKPCR